MIPINVDRNVSTANYRRFEAAGLLLVTGIFRTIQGEGPFAGEPCVFLRLAGCNLGAKVDCPWCDTQFAYDAGTPMTLTGVREAIADMLDGATLVVVTGGEPLLQWPPVKALISSMHDLSLYWQFETNGLLLKGDIVEEAITDPSISFVISPKIPAGHRYPEPRTAWTRLPPDRLALKYVVSADPASQYHRPGPCRGHTTYLSGMTVYRRPVSPGEVANIWDQTLIDHEATAANYRHAAQLVLSEPDLYLLSLQTHLFASVE